MSSVSIPNDCDSSTVTTPSLPTLSIVSAIFSPSSTLSAEIVATCLISSSEVIWVAIPLRASTTSAAACSIPVRTAIELIPIVVCLRPSLKSAWVSTVAVVVPSPATSLVFCATSLMISAPMFSNLSLRKISLAIETPSLVIVGPENPLSRITLRPRGPSVTFTAFATVSTPFCSFFLSSSP